MENLFVGMLECGLLASLVFLYKNIIKLVSSKGSQRWGGDCNGKMEEWGKEAVTGDRRPCTMRTDGLNRSLSLWPRWWGGSANESWSKTVQDDRVHFSKGASLTQVARRQAGRHRTEIMRKLQGRETDLKKAKYTSLKPPHLPKNFKRRNSRWTLN